MDSVFLYLSEFVRLLVEQWVWVILAGSLLFLVWYRNATSPLPSRRPSLGRR